MPPDAPPERPRSAPPPDPFQEANDFRSHNQSLEIAMRRADFLIAAYGTRPLTPAERAELPVLATQLRQMFAVQRSSTMRRIDRADGSYDNADIDNRLRVQLRRIRNMDIDMNRMWGTRMIRKVSSWFSEDMPNYLGVKWDQFTDNAWQFLKVAGVTAAATAGGYALWGSLMGDGALAGLQTFGRHAGQAGRAIGRGANAVRRTIFG